MQFPRVAFKGLVINNGEGGGATLRGGGSSEVLPYTKKGGSGKGFSHAETGAQHVLG